MRDQLSNLHLFSVTNKDINFFSKHISSKAYGIAYFKTTVFLVCIIKTLLYTVVIDEIQGFLRYVKIISSHMPVYLVFLQVAKRGLQLALCGRNVPALLEPCKLRQGTGHR